MKLDNEKLIRYTDLSLKQGMKTLRVTDYNINALSMYLTTKNILHTVKRKPSGLNIVILKA